MQKGIISMGTLVILTTVIALCSLGVGMYNAVQIRHIMPVVNYTVVMPTPTVTPTPTLAPTATPSAGVRKTVLPTKKPTPTEIIVGTPSGEK